jgi:hypothetical protein
MAAYSLWDRLAANYHGLFSCTYSSILGSLSMAALECNTVALMLKTLGSDQTLDLGGLCVRLLALALGLDFTANDELADL